MKPKYTGIEESIIKIPIPVSTGLAIIGTAVMKMVASMYRMGQIRLTFMGRSKCGCFHLNHGTQRTETPMLS